MLANTNLTKGGGSVTRRVLPVVLVLMLLLAACGGSSDSGSGDSGSGDGATETVPVSIPADLVMVAAFTCNQTMGSTAERAIPIVTRELTKAATMGYTPQEFRGALVSECGESMATLEADPAFKNLFGG